MEEKIINKWMKTIIAISRNLSIDPDKDNGIPLGEIIQSFSMPDEDSFQKKWEELLSYQTHKDLFYFKELDTVIDIKDELLDKKIKINFTKQEENKLKIRGEVKEKLGGNLKYSDLSKTTKSLKV